VPEVRFDRKRRKQYAARQSEGTYRSEFGVVKRQILRSPGRGCKPVGHGRGVSLEEMPVTHEARVLVIGSWEAEVGRKHRVRLSAASRKTDRRKVVLARSEAIVPLARRMAGSEKGLCFGWSQFSWGNSGELASQKRVLKTRSSESVCENVKRS